MIRQDTLTNMTRIINTYILFVSVKGKKCYLFISSCQNVVFVTNNVLWCIFAEHLQLIENKLSF